MKDIITMTTDSLAFLAEVEATFPNKVQYDESKPPIAVGVRITKTPTIRSAKGTLAVCRVDTQELADIKTLSTVTILAEVAMGGGLLAAMTPANRKLYDSMHSQKSVTTTDSFGNTSTHTPPALIGSFA